jgi:5-oxoprolinase (ATP-hydrolysing)/N-methylhydantoinase A
LISRATALPIALFDYPVLYEPTARPFHSDVALSVLIVIVIQRLVGLESSLGWPALETRRFLVSYRVGLDIGGTFTDLVLLHGKSAPLAQNVDDPARSADGATQRGRTVPGGIRVTDIGTVIHATTLVTNAIIERRGARTALLVTDGFRDILEMGKEQRYDIYDLFLRYPDPLVPRRWRLEVHERITRDGDIRTPIDLVAVRAHVTRLVESGVEAIAVVFLHAYKNAAHERAVRDVTCISPA